MRQMATGTVCGVIICVHTKEPPSDAEWNELVEQAKIAKASGKPKSIVFTDGGGPNAAQRKIVSDMMKGLPALSAIVTDGAMVRGVVTALSWFIPNVKAFPPDHVHEAYQHLKLLPAEIVQVTAEAAKLRRRLGEAK